MRWWRWAAMSCVANVREVNGEPIADITVKSSELRGITVDGDLVVRMIDEFPIFAVLATQAQGETIVREAEELRVKESDRIGSLASELRKLGVQIEERPDGFVIDGPTRLHGAVVDSHGDHRLAMSLAVAGLIAEGETTVTHAEAYRESFPNFVELMRGSGRNSTRITRITRYESISAISNLASIMTQTVGLIGWPVEHSRSPAMHNAAFAALGSGLALHPAAHTARST